MIGHEAIGDEANWHALGREGEQLAKAVVILILLKDLGAAVAAVQDVIAEPSLSGARGSWHGMDLEMLEKKVEQCDDAPAF